MRCLKATALVAALALLATTGPATAQNTNLPTLPGPSQAPPPQSPPTPAPPTPAPTPRAAPTPGSGPASGSGGSGGSSSSSSSSSGGIGGPGGSAGSRQFTDADLLTFAFNLECLEGQFYSCAANGSPLPTSITGNGPAPSSCSKANLNQTTATYAAELAREEAAHVALLQNALTQAGASPVCPSVNIDTAFEAAAEAALGQPGQPLNPTFNPYANDVFFLHAAFLFEDLGASAYQGAQAALQNATLRGIAGQIGNAESYHSSLDRTLLYPLLSQTAAYGKTVQQITSGIVAAINMLAEAPQVKYELTNDQGSSISNVDSNALVPVATPSQVLRVVTLGAQANSGGGFFPNNLNGNIHN